MPPKIKISLKATKIKLTLKAPPPPKDLTCMTRKEWMEYRKPLLLKWDEENAPKS